MCAPRRAAASLALLLLTACPGAPPVTVVGDAGPGPGSLGGTAGWERRNTVLYQVWVSAFRGTPADAGAPAVATGNTGTLAGITDAIESGYFGRLGVTGLWLSPVFQASSLTPGSANKHGYDTEDYDTVSPLYGDRAALAELLRSAHAHGLRVLFDYVPNHTSSAHPWFQEAAASATSIRRDWYVWQPQAQPWPEGGQGWWPSGGAFYYGYFGGGMPDLDYRTPAVVAEMNAVVQRWLDFGFDGMRVDAARHLYEGTTASAYADQPETHAYFGALRARLDAYPAGQARMMMAESWVGDLPILLSYLGSGGAPEFQVVLDFIWPGTLAAALADGGVPAAAVAAVAGHLVDDGAQARATGGTLGLFQSNHDLAAPRPATLFGGEGRRMYLAAALTLLGPGVPIVYYGNEVGMTGSLASDSQMRRPFDWPAEAALEALPDSLWQWHRAVLRLRTGAAAFADPALHRLGPASDPGVLAYRVSSPTGASVVVVANLAPSATSFTVPLGATRSVRTLLGRPGDVLDGGTLSVSSLPAYGLRVLAEDDPAAAVVLDHDPTPVDVDLAPTTLPGLYLRGTFNGWDTSTPMSLGAGRYSATQAFASTAPVQFKFGSADWTEAYGFDGVAYDASAVAGAVPAGAFADDGAPFHNIRFTPPAAGSFTFTLDYARRAYWVK